MEFVEECGCHRRWNRVRFGGGLGGCRSVIDLVEMLECLGRLGFDRSCSMDGDVRMDDTYGVGTRPDSTGIPSRTANSWSTIP